MADKMPDKFMSVSKKLLEDHPDLKQKLQKVMGRVADTIVKDKYVDENTAEKSSEANDDGRN
ncbi:hypothetical protein [Desulfovibrio sp. JC010]|uniref:hypothetical protein n=1 Tax=Desulfovibrio sp. JC010 TaxID=2593641 RepID=UPI0013D66D3D|nr:hypothetical protein [Desulfovibrio sp. JC010]NDV27576.1 hypothetical protein [Desulfovibrio sp. JC010]